MLAAARPGLHAYGYSAGRATSEFTLQTLEIRVDFRGTLAAQFAALFQSFGDDFFQLGGQTTLQLCGWHWCLVEDGIEGGSRSCTLKGQSSRSHFVEHNAEREQIGAGVEFFAKRLLGRHIGHRTQSCARDGVLGEVFVHQSGGFTNVRSGFR